MKKITLISISVILCACAPMSKVDRLKSAGAKGHYELSLMYRFGNDVEQSAQLSRQYLQSSASRGHIGATYRLAMDLDNEGSYKDAAYWYKQASSDGINTHAIYRLAQIHHQGLINGTPDLPKAKSLYIRSAQKGFMEGAHFAAQISLEIKQYKDAFTWSSVASKGGYYSEEVTEAAKENLSDAELKDAKKKANKYSNLYIYE